MKNALFFAALLLAGTVPAWAEDAPPPAGDTAPAAAPAQKLDKHVCLRHDYVWSWGARDDHSMTVRDRFGSEFLVSLRGLCRDLPFALGAGFDPPGRLAAGFCVERGDRLIMRGGGATGIASGSCWVTKVQHYTAEMKAADKLARASKQPLAAY